MRKIASFLIISSLMAILSGNHLFAQQDPIVMKIGEEKITLT